MANIEIDEGARMKFVKYKLYAYLFAIYSFLLSYGLFHLYVKGDQLLYIKFYDSISKFNFFSGFVFYDQAIGSQEPIYYVLVYLLNGLFSKTLLFSLINSAFGYLLARRLLENGFMPLLFLLLVPFNFYLMTLYFSLERLKLSLLFFMISFYVKSRPINISLLLLSIFTHVQTFLFLIGMQLTSLFPLVKKLLRGRINFKIFGLLVSMILLCGVLFLVRAHILHKFNAYAALGGVRNLIKPTFFLIITLLYARDKKLKAFFMHFPIIIAAFFLGDMRLVIFSYFIFFYYASSYNRGLNVGIVVSSIYFIIKGVVFIYGILLYGNGYALSV